MKKYLDSKVFQIGLTAIIVICICILFYFLIGNIPTILEFLGEILNILKPLIIGLILAYVMKPIVALFEKHIFINVKNDKTRRYLSISCTVLVIIAIIASLISVIIPQIIVSVDSLLDNVPNYINSISSKIKDWFNNSSIESSLLTNLDSISSIILNAINNVVLPSSNSVFEMLSSIFGSIISFLFNLIVGTVFAVYILANTKNFKISVRKILYSMFNVDKVNGFLDELGHVNKVFSNFLIAKIIDSFCFVFVCTFIFLLIFKYPYPLLIAVIIGLTDLIPYFGPYIGTIPSALLILLVSPAKAIAFVIFIVILQQIDGNFVTPRIQKQATGLPSFWVLFAITFFGGLFGVIGMIIGVPCFTIIYEIFNDLVNKKLKQKRIPTDEALYASSNGIERKIVKAKE